MARGPVKPLPAERLRRRCELDALHFRTTDDLPVTQKIIGQDRVEREGFRLEQVQMGPIVKPTIVPLVAGEAATFDRFEELIAAGKLTKEESEAIEKRHDHLTEEMERVLKEARLIDQEAQSRLE